MKRWPIILMTVIVLLQLQAFGKTMVINIRSQNLDPRWQFLPMDVPGAEQPQFDDRAWHTVDLPHDWSIEGPFAETNRTGGSGGFLPSGVGWYRRAFTVSEVWSDRRVFVEFDGVMQNSEVWINGVSLGKRPFGYVSFGYELTGHLKFGNYQTNILAVRADTSDQPASRWYSGAGIYRHVWLVVTDPIHFERWGVFVSTPQVSATQATVRVETSLANQSGLARDIIVQTVLIAPDGKSVASIETKALLPGAPVSGPARSNNAPEHAGPEAGAPSGDRFIQQIILPGPQLWNLDDPKLYRAVSEVRDGEKILDRQVTPFGIREAKFEADTGFWLNGKNFKIKGVCVHHDGGAFGAAVPLGVWEQRLTTLKSLGVNAIRTAHNPPAPEFLDLCDRLGLLVMDEFFDCWTVPKNPYDYHLYFNEWSKTDERDTILRDRNHPSVILYSVGNEIHDTPKAELARGILQGLVETAHAADPTRPVTQALFRPNVSGDYTNGLADLLDVIGTNYRDNELLAAQRAKPSRKIIGTEQRHDRQTWLWLRDNPSHSGQFLWSGIDYLGESRRWPVIAAGSGLLDRTGAPKPMAFERQSWWSDRPMVYLTRRIATNAVGPTDPGYEPAQQDALRRPQVLFPDWTPKNSQPHDENVEVYSNCQDVELFLNGKSLGTKPLNADATPRVWKVAWVPSTLKAVARNDGKVVATDELRTAGKPAKILLSIGRADLLVGQDARQRVPTAQTQLPLDWNAVALVRATVVDKHDVVVPGASDLISFAISGPGTIAAVDNADNASHEPFQASERHAFQGKCVAFVKATAPSGKITLTASAPGLKSGKLVLQACPPVSAP
jgi:beta-galactosidase